MNKELWVIVCKLRMIYSFCFFVKSNRNDVKMFFLDELFVLSMKIVVFEIC